MIAVLMIATLVFTLLVNLIGLTLAAKCIIPNYLLAKMGRLFCFAWGCFSWNMHTDAATWLGWAFR